MRPWGLFLLFGLSSCITSVMQLQPLSSDYKNEVKDSSQVLVAGKKTRDVEINIQILRSELLPCFVERSFPPENLPAALPVRLTLFNFGNESYIVDAQGFQLKHKSSGKIYRALNVQTLEETSLKNMLHFVWINGLREKGYYLSKTPSSYSRIYKDLNRLTSRSAIRRLAEMEKEFAREHLMMNPGHGLTGLIFFDVKQPGEYELILNPSPPSDSYFGTSDRNLEGKSFSFPSFSFRINAIHQKNKFLISHELNFYNWLHQEKSKLKRDASDLYISHEQFRNFMMRKNKLD